MTESSVYGKSLMYPTQPVALHANSGCAGKKAGPNRESHSIMGPFNELLLGISPPGDGDE